MNKKRCAWIAAIALLIISGAYLYNGVLYKEARNIAEEKAAFQLPSLQLIAEYKANLPASDSSYLNKTLEIRGKVTQVSDSLLTLDSGVSCSFGKKMDDAIHGKEIILKGRCIGFDELMEEVKLDQCTLIQ